MIIVSGELGTLDQVIFKGGACGGVKGHEATFVELRFTNHEPIRGDILEAGSWGVLEQKTGLRHTPLPVYRDKIAIRR